MSGRQWAVLFGTMLTGALGVFLGADIDLGAVDSWRLLLAPKYILGSAAAMAAALVAFFSKGPNGG